MCEAPLRRDRVELSFHLLGPANRHEAVSLDHLGSHHGGHRDESAAAGRHDLRQRRILKLGHHVRFHTGPAEPFFKVSPEVAILGWQKGRRAVEIQRETAFELLGQSGHCAECDLGRSKQMIENLARDRRRG